MDGDGKKPLKIAVLEFYKLFLGFFSFLSKCPKMFDHLKGQVHAANQSGLKLYELFVIQSCQKIKYNALFIMIFSLVANFGDHPLL